MSAGLCTGSVGLAQVGVEHGPLAAGYRAEHGTRLTERPSRLVLSRADRIKSATALVSPGGYAVWVQNSLRRTSVVQNTPLEHPPPSCIHNASLTASQPQVTHVMCLGATDVRNRTEPARKCRYKDIDPRIVKSFNQQGPRSCPARYRYRNRPGPRC